MKLNTLFIVCALTVAAFAKEDRIVGKVMPRLSVQKADESQLIEGAEVHNTALEAEKVSNGKFYYTENEFTNKKLKKSKKSEEMNQDEADADLAAYADSIADDRFLKKFELDMSTAYLPTESRRIAGAYGPRSSKRMHRGVDLGLCHGENRTIVAAFAGKVVRVRNQGYRKGYGRYVILDHGNGLTTLYAHLQRWKVKVGEYVQAGDTIGIGGNSGRSFGAHLHFEMRYNGLYINPATVFDFENGTFHNVVTVIDPAKLIEEEERYVHKNKMPKTVEIQNAYRVQRGDCLGKIANRYGITVQKLREINHLKNDKILPGQILRGS